MSAATFVRPNGKVYRPRKPGLEVREYQDHYSGDEGLVVFGTHDYHEAANFAGSRMADLDLDRERSELTWWREVPWGNGGDFERSWIEDAVRGRPCVVFEPTPWTARR